MIQKQFKKILNDLKLDILNFIGYDIIKRNPIMYLKPYVGISKYKDLSFHTTPIGNYYLPIKSDQDWIAQCMRRGLLFDEVIIEVAKKYIKPNTVVLDIGANYGQMSIEFAKYVGEKGIVYSFDAQKKVYDILVKNVDVNCPSLVKTFYNAVYDVENKLFRFPTPTFDIVQTLGCFGLNPTIDEGEEVYSITIDSLKIDKPISFMKIDIQGSDIFALRGAKETIFKHRMPIIFEFEQHLQAQFQTSFQDYVDFVASINYHFVECINSTNFLILPNDF